VSSELAALARPFLDERRLLQVLLRPESWRVAEHSRIEAPVPFVYYQVLVVEQRDLNGSDNAVDAFRVRLMSGEKILAELARLGGLPRPRDRWNARIVFVKPDRRFRKIVLVEYSPEDGRVLRRQAEDWGHTGDASFETAIGNRWRVLDGTTAEVLDELEVGEDNAFVLLPQRERWWKGRG
jgi:hypothetical protein